ncbi:hypothetical protein E1202_00215 [Saccharopolyspora karakumensis]|uniref:Small secreted domain n=1 Tax=Saccharopolyspora karakumensis TaxID=2530386 RepID=A0A4R5C7T3_9PSEU|nr:hypothetical protein [Saccharopolyspora karakumensis]TDD93104.1 hypothetical protein E1202_00215 [Saccharopolyspora karakumensis]
MRIATRVAGAAGVAALSIVTLGSTAFADTADNDGVNLLDDNNISAVPVQACGNNVAVVGLTVPLLSPQNAECVNAPVVDHPQG